MAREIKWAAVALRNLITSNPFHYIDISWVWYVAIQITSNSIACSTACSGWQQMHHQSSALLIDRWFPSQRACNAESILISWCHQILCVFSAICNSTWTMVPKSICLRQHPMNWLSISSSKSEGEVGCRVRLMHDDVMTRRRFLHYCPFVIRRMHWSVVDS